MFSNDILAKIEENMESLKKYGVKKIGLFGSYATNQQTEKSDIDFLVKFNKGQKTYDNFFDLKFFLEDLFDRKIDLVTPEYLKPRLKNNILEQVKYAKEEKASNIS